MLALPSLMVRREPSWATKRILFRPPGSFPTHAILSPSLSAPGPQFEAEILTQAVQSPDATGSAMHQLPEDRRINPGLAADLISGFPAALNRSFDGFQNHKIHCIGSCRFVNRQYGEFSLLFC
jgi:hypothetical protein